MSEKMYPTLGLGDSTMQKKLEDHLTGEMDKAREARAFNKQFNRIVTVDEEAKTEEGPNFVDIYGEMAKAMQRTYVVYRTCLNCGVKQNLEIPKGKLARDFKCPICEVSPREAE